MDAERLTLSSGRLRLELSPEMGGCITSFTFGEGDSRQFVMRDGGSATGVLESASFPLVPFVNRIRGGQFTFRERTIRLRPNMAGDANPLHGQGWLRAWQIRWASEDKAVLHYAHHSGEWPWDYEAQQEFALDSGGLSLRLTCRNVSPEAMPCGLGQHPYFPCRPETRIDAHVDCAWTIDDQVLPAAKVAAKGRYELSQRSICGQDLDNGFGGWSGEATISDPSWPFDLRLRSPQCRYFHIYSPPQGGFFAAEPVMHANAALNEPEDRWPDLGLVVLEPGEEMSLDVRLDVLEKRTA